jgi:hypothetical protein
MGNNATQKVVQDLGALHRACLWESIVLKAGLTSRGIDVAATPNDSSREGSPVQPSNTAAPPAGNSALTPTGVPWRRLPPESTLPNKHSDDPLEIRMPREQNAKALQHIAHGIPVVLAPFWQGILAIMKLILWLNIMFSYCEDVLRAAQSRSFTEETDYGLRIRCSRHHAQAYHAEDIWYESRTIVVKQNTKVYPDDIVSSYTYYSVMLGLITVCLVDGMH